MATYSDAMTLLMTFFVLLMTFSTSSPFRNFNSEVALVGGERGAGMAGELSRGPDRSAVVWRDFSLAKPQGPLRSETRPQYSDPVIPKTEDALRVLAHWRPVG
jgi:hypothetical protein